MATSFHLFPKLPQEIRDAIWRECLPRRVIEIDFPTEDWIWLDVPLDDDGQTTYRGLRCRMAHTSMINAKPPIISRVCRESRAVAFETGTLVEHSWELKGPRLYHRMNKHWVDRARDTVVNLSFNHRSRLWYENWKEGYGNPVQILRDAILPSNGIKSISELLLCDLKRKESRDMLESMSKVLVCLETVILHADEEPAIQSGLFGRLGEERVVMVDTFDEKRVKEFRDFWRRHRNTPNELTEKFFEECIVSDPIQCRRTVLKVMEDIKTKWLLERWYDTTGPWVRQQDVMGITRWRQDFRIVPGLVREQVWTKAPVRNNRHSSISFWTPNQEHPWVKATYSSMPQFIPVVMFRFCTNTYMDRGEKRRCW